MYRPKLLFCQKLPAAFALFRKFESLDLKFVELIARLTLLKTPILSLYTTSVITANIVYGNC